MLRERILQTVTHQIQFATYIFIALGPHNQKNPVQSKIKLCDRTIGANCPGTSGTVPDLELSSRVPHGTCFLCEMSRKFYSPELSNNYNLPVMLVYRTRSLWALNNALLVVGGVNREVTYPTHL